MAQETMTYRQRISAFSEAVREQGYEKLGFDDAGEFCNVVRHELDNLPRFINSTARFNNAHALLKKQDDMGQGYSDIIEPWLAAFGSTRESARRSIDRLNRYFAIMGLEPFADIDTRDDSAVERICGEIVLEAVGDTDAGHDAFDVTVNIGGGFRLFRDWTFTKKYRNDRLEVSVTNLYGDWDPTEVTIKSETIIPGALSYDVTTRSGISVMCKIDYDMNSLDPDRIDRLSDILKYAKQDIADIKALLGVLFPGVTVTDSYMK